MPIYVHIGMRIRLCRPTPSLDGLCRRHEDVSVALPLGSFVRPAFSDMSKQGRGLERLRKMSEPIGPFPLPLDLGTAVVELRFRPKLLAFSARGRTDYRLASGRLRGRLIVASGGLGKQCAPNRAGPIKGDNGRMIYLPRIVVGRPCGSCKRQEDTPMKYGQNNPK